jgi:hypothetical protein
VVAGPIIGSERPEICKYGNGSLEGDMKEQKDKITNASSESEDEGKL